MLTTVTTLLIYSAVQAAHSDDTSRMDAIWSSWDLRTKQCGAIQATFESNVTTPLLDRRDIKAITLQLDGNGTTKYETTVTMKQPQGTSRYSEVKIVLDDCRVDYLEVEDKRKRAMLVSRSTLSPLPPEIATMCQLFHPSDLAMKDDYNTLTSVEVNGTECDVLRRTADIENGTMTVTLYLREDLGFLPIRETVQLHQFGKEFAHLQSDFTYENVEGLLQPKAWVLRETFNPGQPNEEFRKSLVRRTSVELNADLAADCFTVQLPKGTEVLDHRGKNRSKISLVEAKTFPSDFSAGVSASSGE